MSLADFLARMPKVELHVHLEGSIRPETLLKLAHRNRVSLPADTVEGLREWYKFRDFKHFVDVYVAASSCIKSPDDIELIAFEFLQGQAFQNILHSEVTYTAETIYRLSGIAWSDQLAAINRARKQGEEELGVTMELIVDIVRELSPESGAMVADWAISAKGNGVCALGLSGVEAETRPQVHAESFQRAKAAGLGVSTHAGETHGPESIWDCLEIGADRIGHGVRCLEDDALVDELRARQTPLEVCPSSNVCLCGVSSIRSHPIDALIKRGLNVTVNSDDPPMFNTTLTNEWVRCAEEFSWTTEDVKRTSGAAIEASFASEMRKQELRAALESYFASM